MTTTQDIIGRECINHERITFDDCRKCYGRDYRCPNYLAREMKRFNPNNFPAASPEKHFPNATYCNEVSDSPPEFCHLSLWSDAFYLGHSTLRDVIKPKSINTIRNFDRGCI